MSKENWESYIWEKRLDIIVYSYGYTNSLYIGLQVSVTSKTKGLSNEKPKV